MPSRLPSESLDHLFNELSERAENCFRTQKQYHLTVSELKKTIRALEQSNQTLLRENQTLHQEHQALHQEHTHLKQRCLSLESTMSGLQTKLKALAKDQPLVDSSAALQTLIRETLDPEEWESHKPAPITESLPAKFDANLILAQWGKRYPKAFSSVSVQPLKTGIHEDLAKQELLPDHWIRRAIASYVRSPRYLRVLKAGAVRMDLHGNNAGFVSTEEAQHAKEQLEQIRQQRLEKEQKLREQEEQQRLEAKLAKLVQR